MGNPTLKNVTVPAGSWVSVYDLLNNVSGSQIAPGTAIGISVLDNVTKINVGSTKPTDESGWEWLRQYEYAECESGDPGFWILAPYVDALINIKVIG
jgi:hypothetical protein